MYSLIPEKPLRLVYEPFYLSILCLKTFYEVINTSDPVKENNTGP